MKCKCIPAHEAVCIARPEIRPENCRHKILPPVEKVYDFNGMEIVVGSNVAYNLSGDVVLGKVRAIIYRAPYYESNSRHYDPADRYQFKIECMSINHWKYGEVSLISNKKGIACV